MLLSGKTLNKAFVGFRIVAALATAVAFLGLQFAPPKYHQIHPSPVTYVHAYADSVEPDGRSTVEWLDREDFVFKCEVREGVEWRYCGLSLKFFEEPRKDPIVITNEHFAYGKMHPIDLSGYDHLLVDMNYDGSENYIRIFMRNAFEMPKVFEEHNQQKFINEAISKGEMTNQIKILLAEFSVADWWVAQFQKGREDSVPTFDKIFEIGVDFVGQPPIGTHTFSVKKIVAVGSYFNKESVYFSIIAFWLCIGFIEFSRQLAIAISRQRQIAHENSNLRKLALTDSLTGLANRNGIYQFVRHKFPVSEEDSMYLLVIDLDHFKNINDGFGHHVGDEVLKEVSRALQKAIRKADLLGRWGGEEFLVLCQSADDEIGKIIQRLRSELTKVVVHTHTGDILVTMSIGATKATTHDTFEGAFKRADNAAYIAKAAGRNTWKMV